MSVTAEATGFHIPAREPRYRSVLTTRLLTGEQDKGLTVVMRVDKEEPSLSKAFREVDGASVLATWIRTWGAE